jgi:hypothetical protein
MVHASVTADRAGWLIHNARQAVSSATRKPAWSLALDYKPLIMIDNIDTFKN